MPPDRLAQIRQQELDHALRVLGVSESTVLGYEDGTLDAVDPELGARRIMTVLDEIDPDVVVSFGPDGVTAHPDHIAVGAWTELAVTARCPEPALIQTAVGRWMPSELVTAMDELGAYRRKTSSRASLTPSRAQAPNDQPHHDRQHDAPADRDREREDTPQDDQDRDEDQKAGIGTHGAPGGAPAP